MDSNGRTIWIVDAHRGDGKRFVVHAEEKLTAFVELESAIRAAANGLTFNRSGLVYERDLSRWIARRGQGDNPIHVHSHVEAQDLCVELSALMNPVAGDKNKVRSNLQTS